MVSIFGGGVVDNALCENWTGLGAGFLLMGPAQGDMFELVFPLYPADGSFERAILTLGDSVAACEVITGNAGGSKYSGSIVEKVMFDALGRPASSS